MDTELRVNLQQQVYIHCVLVHRGLPVRRTMCDEAAVYLVEAVFLEGDVLWQFLLKDKPEESRLITERI